jgi:hypothetical protein
MISPDLLNELRFYQHSLAQIAAIEQEIRAFRHAPARGTSLRAALFAATELVVHGSEQACDFIRYISRQVTHPDVQQYLDRLSKQAKFIRGIAGLDEIRRNKALVSELYKLNGIFFARGERHHEKLLVVFTTVFNNFYVSNLVFYAMLRHFGVSILFLKDTSLHNYLNGIVGFGNDIVQVSQRIKSVVQREGISEVYITGFSSGGYASLFCSNMLPCCSYVGFSLRSDLSRSSLLHPGKFFTEEVRSCIDERWLKNLRDILLGAHRFPRRDIYFGSEYAVDVEHARNLEGIPGTTIICLPGCDHQTIAALMESDRLTSIFQSLLFESENVIGNLSKS